MDGKGVFIKFETVDEKDFERIVVNGQYPRWFVDMTNDVRMNRYNRDAIVARFNQLTGGQHSIRPIKDMINHLEYQVKNGKPYSMMLEIAVLARINEMDAADAKKLGWALSQKHGPNQKINQARARANDFIIFRK